MSTGKVLRRVVGVMMVTAGAAGAYVRFLRPWLLRRGATDAEVERALPGDDLVQTPQWTATQAITIHAAPDAIWPWIAQWGYGRGGFYSYDWIDRLIGAAGVVSSDRILPEHQQIHPGDFIPVAPNGGFVVSDVQPGRYLLLQNRLDLQTAQQIPPTTQLPEKYVDVTWALVLEPEGAERTRLISRMRMDTRFTPSPAASLFMGELLKPGSAIMDYRMLQGIKCRAEGTCLQTNDA